jgi:translocation and assembly module TamB
VDSRLAAVALDGQLTATQGSGGLRFEAQLQPATRQSVNTASTQLRSLRLQTVQAKGLWSAPSLNLEQLLVQTADAKLEGSAKLDTASWATDAQLALALPGAQASLQGDLSASRGDGKLVVKVSDAARAALWLDQLPGAPVALPSLLRQGQSEFSADWHGGWERQNTLNGLALGLSARVDNGNQKLALAAKLQGGRVKLRDWQASVDAVDLTLQTPTRPGIWNLALTDPVQLHYQQNPLHQTLEISGSGARLSGPAPGTARLQWQAARWDQAQTTPGTRHAGAPRARYKTYRWPGSNCWGKRKSPIWDSKVTCCLVGSGTPVVAKP